MSNYSKLVIKIIKTVRNIIFERWRLRNKVKWCLIKINNKVVNT
jgi:hypothetical protein